MQAAMCSATGYTMQGIAVSGNLGLLDFLLGSKSRADSMNLTLVRVLPLRVKSYLLLLSDGSACSFALAIDNESLFRLVHKYGACVQGSLCCVMLAKCAAAKGPPVLLCRQVQMLSLEKNRKLPFPVSRNGARAEMEMQREMTRRADMNEVVPVRGPCRVVDTTPPYSALARFSLVDACLQGLSASFEARLCVAGVWQDAERETPDVVLTDGERTVLVEGAQLKGVTHGDVVDVSGRMLEGVQGGYVRASVQQYSVVGEDRACLARLACKGDLLHKQVSVWHQMGKTEPESGKMVHDEVLQDAMMERADKGDVMCKSRRFTLQEYFSLRMWTLDQGDYVKYGRFYYVALSLPSLHAEAGQFSKLGRSVVPLKNDRDVLGLILTHLSATEIARMRVVCRFFRKEVVLLCSSFTQDPDKGADASEESVPEDSAQKEYTRYLKHLVDVQLWDCLRPRSEAECATGVPCVSFQTPSIARSFGQFYAENSIKCVCGGSAKYRHDNKRCVFCILALDKNRYWPGDWSESALTKAMEKVDSMEWDYHDLTDLVHRHDKIISGNVSLWKRSTYIQTYLSQNMNVGGLQILTGPPVLQKEERSQIALYTQEKVREHLRDFEHLMWETEETDHFHFSEFRIGQGGGEDARSVRNWYSILQHRIQVQPLVPGVIRMVYDDAVNECMRLRKAWDDRAEGLSQEGSMPAVVFSLPDADAEMFTAFRVTVQVCGDLFFFATVLYGVGLVKEDIIAFMFQDDNRVSFVGHDGLTKTIFTTDCDSFFDIVWSAIKTRELDIAFKKKLKKDCVDPLSQLPALERVNVIENFVLDMTVHTIRPTAFMSGEHEYLEETERVMMYELLCSDFVVRESSIGPLSCGPESGEIAELFIELQHFYDTCDLDMDLQRRLRLTRNRTHGELDETSPGQSQSLGSE